MPGARGRVSLFENRVRPSDLLCPVIRGDLALFCQYRGPACFKGGAGWCFCAVAPKPLFKFSTIFPGPRAVGAPVHPQDRAIDVVAQSDRGKAPNRELGAKHRTRDLLHEIKLRPPEHLQGVDRI